MKHDRTFSETSAYASTAWCAERLGKSVAWFRANRATLEREGFPRVDAVLGLTLKDDVQAFLDRRRKVADANQATATMAFHHITMKERLHEL